MLAGASSKDNADAHAHGLTLCASVFACYLLLFVIHNVTGANNRIQAQLTRAGIVRFCPILFVPLAVIFKAPIADEFHF